LNRLATTEELAELCAVIGQGEGALLFPDGELERMKARLGPTPHAHACADLLYLRYPRLAPVPSLHRRAIVLLGRLTAERRLTWDERRELTRVLALAYIRGLSEMAEVDDLDAFLQEHPRTAGARCVLRELQRLVLARGAVAFAEALGHLEEQLASGGELGNAESPAYDELRARDPREAQIATSP
jgi:hypothetical protein